MSFREREPGHIATLGNASVSFFRGEDDSLCYEVHLDGDFVGEGCVVPRSTEKEWLDWLKERGYPNCG